MCDFVAIEAKLTRTMKKRVGRGRVEKNDAACVVREMRDLVLKIGGDDDGVGRGRGENVGKKKTTRETLAVTEAANGGANCGNVCVSGMIGKTCGVRKKTINDVENGVATRSGKIEVDVGERRAKRMEETLGRDVVGDGIDVGNAGEKNDEGRSGGAANDEWNVGKMLTDGGDVLDVKLGGSAAKPGKLLSEAVAINGGIGERTNEKRLERHAELKLHAILLKTRGYDCEVGEKTAAERERTAREEENENEIAALGVGAGRVSGKMCGVCGVRKNRTAASASCGAVQ